MMIDSQNHSSLRKHLLTPPYTFPVVLITKTRLAFFYVTQMHFFPSVIPCTSVEWIRLLQRIATIPDQAAFKNVISN